MPAVVDLAAMRDAMKALGGDPEKINPLIPVDLVVDHSVQVDHFGGDSALQLNVQIEFQRNRERYEFLRWGQQAFDNFSKMLGIVSVLGLVNPKSFSKFFSIELWMKLKGPKIFSAHSKTVKTVFCFGQKIESFR